MNTGGFVESPISQDQVLVIIALALAGLLALLVVIGMVWGARLKRQRVHAEEEEKARIEELEADGVEATNTAEAAPAEDEPSAIVPPTPTPTAPTPPPLGDQPAPGTPAQAEPQAVAPVATRVETADSAPAEPSLADEPVAAAAPLDASPATVAADPVAASTGSASGTLTQVKGLGPKIAARLEEEGVSSVEQLAALDDAAAAALDDRMGPFKGRMTRDRWREQARLLAAGDRVGFEREFGKLG